MGLPLHSLPLATMPAAGVSSTCESRQELPGHELSWRVLLGLVALVGIFSHCGNALADASLPAANNIHGAAGVDGALRRAGQLTAGVAGRKPGAAVGAIPTLYDAVFIETLVQQLGVPFLRDHPTASGDIEVRIWRVREERGEASYVGEPDLQGYVLQRHGAAGQWRGMVLTESYRSVSSPVKRPAQRQAVYLDTGWNLLWSKLLAEGITTLPDAGNTQWTDYGGWVIVVEVSISGSYRAYSYHDLHRTAAGATRASEHVIRIHDALCRAFNRVDCPRIE